MRILNLHEKQNLLKDYEISLVEETNNRSELENKLQQAQSNESDLELKIKELQELNKKKYVHLIYKFNDAIDARINLI